jgi:hypothetical protein
MFYLDDIELFKSVFILKISNNPNHFLMYFGFFLLFLNGLHGLIAEGRFGILDNFHQEKSIKYSLLQAKTNILLLSGTH